MFFSVAISVSQPRGKCQPRHIRLPNAVATEFGNEQCMFFLKKHCSARFLITSRHSASRAHFADVLIAQPLPTRSFSDRKKNVSQCNGVKQCIRLGFTALFLPPNFPNRCGRFSTVPAAPTQSHGEHLFDRCSMQPQAAISTCCGSISISTSAHPHTRCCRGQHIQAQSSRARRARI